MLGKKIFNQKLMVILLFMLVTFKVSAQKFEVADLKVEYSLHPIGIDNTHPRFSWKLESSRKGISQQSYEIRVAEKMNDLKSGKNLIWESGEVKNAESNQVNYAGKPLKSKTRYYWEVRVKDNNNKKSAWTTANYWQTGMLSPTDWTAKWITTFVGDTTLGPSPYFRKTFNSSKTIKSATAYITAHGMYEAHLNGKRIGSDFFTPGWTSYKKRLLYQTYDVTDMVKKGENTVGLIIGDGWYKGHIGFNGQNSYYGNQLGGLLQLEIEYTDGEKQLVQTDDSWKYHLGPIITSDLYNGETYDARLELSGWASAGYNAAKWKSVAVIPAGTEKIESSISPLARKHEEFKPKQLITTPKGEIVLDFGQNLVGWVKFKVKGEKGAVVKIEHAEVLDKAGNFYTENLRSAKQLITYTLKGDAEETYEPHFTYQGFRYIKLEGFLGTPKLADFTAIAVYSDMKTTGTFITSNPMINQLQHNILWGQKGNFVDVPTDCPQRDERLGWTGDAQVFSSTAAYNMDVAGFFTKWMKDVKADQLPNGSVPYVIPDVLGNGQAGSAGWGDAATVIPWNMYIAYGDKEILNNQYQSMKMWVDYMAQKSTNNLWNTGSHFGDWLFYRPDDDNDGRAAITDKYLIAQAFYAHSTQLLINAANVLNNQEDVRKYNDLLTAIKAAFVKEYLSPNGRLVSGTQTAYVLALNFDMLPENLRQQAVDRLVDNIKSYGNHITTGFLGTPYLCQVLTRFNRTDVAYNLLLQDTYPSWLYPVKMGATTIWERWDGEKPDGSFENPSMNSFNHYSYGAIGDWMYKHVAGIQPESAGYKQIIIKPEIGGGLTWAEGTFDCAYGTIASKWKINDNKLDMTVTIPPNTTADIFVPNAQGKDYEKHTVASGTYHYSR
ncbi:alpha-L-rhamnosidase [Pedobacter sp. UYEF25]